MAITEVSQATAEKKYLFAEQTTVGFGTAEADAVTGAALCQLDCEPFEIVPDVKRIDNPQSVGSRKPRDSSVIFHSNGSAPTFAITYNAMADNLDHLFAAIFQNVTEGETTPFPKTYTFGDTQPNFRTPAGYAYTFWECDPAASKDVKVFDVISNKMTLTLTLDAPLKVTQEFIARGLPSFVANQTGTPTEASNADMFYAQKLARKTINFGGGAKSFDLVSLEIGLAWNTVQLIGQDGAGSFDTYGLFDLKNIFKIQVVKDSDFHTALTNWSTDVPIDCNFGWGNATPGTVDNDLDFAFHGKIVNTAKAHNQIIEGIFEGEMFENDAGTVEPITAVLANAVDRSW